KSMIKSALLFLMLAMNVQASTPLKNVVLGVDYLAYDNESPYMFPCVAESDVMFCEELISVEDKSCNDSLKITSTDTQKIISCTLSSGETIVIAETEKNAEINDDSTQPAGFYHLNFSNR